MKRSEYFDIGRSRKVAEKLQEETDSATYQKRFHRATGSDGLTRMGEPGRAVSEGTEALFRCLGELVH